MATKRSDITASNEKCLATSMNYKFSKNRKFKTSDEVRTVPNQSYTVKELMERYRNGIIPANLEREMQYDEDPTFETSVLDTPDVDITDVHEENNLINRKIANAKLKKQNAESDITAEKEAQEAKRSESEPSNTIEAVEPSA